MHIKYRSLAPIKKVLPLDTPFCLNNRISFSTVEEIPILEKQY